MDKQASILIVDDEADIRMVCKIFLEEYQLFEAGNVEEAVKHLKDHEINLIVSDIKMPGKSGIEFAEFVCSTYPDIPLILITGYSDKSMAIQAIRYGAFDFIEKPFDQADITRAVHKALERQVLQQELLVSQRRAADLERFSAIGIMAGSIAHEIANPLSSAIGAGYRLQKKIARGELSKEMVQDYLDSLEEMHERIDKITTSLKNLSYCGISGEKVATRIADIVDDVRELCSPKAKESGVKLDFLLANEDLEISCNRIEISQILINLLNNSFQAVENLSERWARVDVSEDNSAIIIKVIDSGTGIADDVKGKLFKGFVTTKPMGKGTGLGLHISKRLIDEHHGQIAIDDEAEHTTFVITFPKVSQKVTA